MSHHIDSTLRIESAEPEWTQAELVRGVQRIVSRVPYSFNGLVRFTYTVTGEGRMTNVRADIYAEPLSCEPGPFRFIKQRLEAQIGAYFEGGLVTALAIGRRQLAIPVAQQVH